MGLPASVGEAVWTGPSLGDTVAWPDLSPKAEHPREAKAPPSSHSAQYDSFLGKPGEVGPRTRQQISVSPSGSHTDYKRINKDGLRVARAWGSQAVFYPGTI